MSVLSVRSLSIETALLSHTGGTPNLTDEVRAIPNIEFAAAWWGGPPSSVKTMPRDIYDTLSPHGQLQCAGVVAGREDSVIEVGYVGPWDKRGRGDNPANSLRMDGRPVAPPPPPPAQRL